MALRGNSPMPVEQFGGLRLDLDATDAGWSNAIDLQNVDFDRHGRVRSRMGTEKFSAAATDQQLTNLFSFQGASDRLIASGTNRTVIYNSAGGVVTDNMLGPVLSAATVGTADETECYLTYGSAVNLIRKFDGTTLTVPTATVDGVAGGAMPIVHVLGVTPWDNRLVAACSEVSNGGPGGATSTVYHVWFSDPGEPTVWGTNNYVMLNPGDGEKITAVVAWRERLFVFKQSTFYVFTGTTTDSTGNPVFNYYAVRSGVGAARADAVVAGRDGVYFFADGHGLFRTTGNEPIPVSKEIAPSFDGTGAAPNTFFSGARDVPNAFVGVHERRILVTVVTGQMFVLDIDTGLWTYWLVPGMGNVQPVSHAFGADRAQLYFGMNVSNDVGRFSKALTADRGNTIDAFYRSGFHAPGGAGVEATVRETILEGQGTVGFSWSRDYGSPAAAVSVVMRNSNELQGRGFHRYAISGEILSYRLAYNHTAPWQVNRVVPFVREARVPALRTTQ